MNVWLQLKSLNMNLIKFSNSAQAIYILVKRERGKESDIVYCYLHWSQYLFNCIFACHSFQKILFYYCCSYGSFAAFFSLSQAQFIYYFHRYLSNFSFFFLSFALSPSFSQYLLHSVFFLSLLKLSCSHLNQKKKVCSKSSDSISRAQYPL